MVVYQPKHRQAEQDSNQTVAHDTQLGVRPIALQDAFVKGQRDLVAAIGNCRAAESHIRRQGRDGGEWEPETSDRVQIREDIRQRQHSQTAADGGPGQTQNAFLHACPNRREGANHASHHRREDPLVSRQRENQVADEPGQRAFDREANVFRIAEGIGHDSASFERVRKYLQFVGQAVPLFCF